MLCVGLFHSSYYFRYLALEGPASYCERGSAQELFYHDCRSLKKALRCGRWRDEKVYVCWYIKLLSSSLQDIKLCVYTTHEKGKNKSFNTSLRSVEKTSFLDRFWGSEKRRFFCDLPPFLGIFPLVILAKNSDFGGPATRDLLFFQSGQNHLLEAIFGHFWAFFGPFLEGLKKQRFFDVL